MVTRKPHLREREQRRKSSGGSTESDERRGSKE